LTEIELVFDEKFPIEFPIAAPNIVP